MKPLWLDLTAALFLMLFDKLTVKPESCESVACRIYGVLSRRLYMSLLLLSTFGAYQDSRSAYMASRGLCQSVEPFSTNTVFGWFDESI